MSQAGIESLGGISPSSIVETLTGNSGGAVGPDASHNINVVGDGVTVNVAGNPGTNTLTISASGTGTMQTLTGNTGGAISPVAGNTNTVGTGSITIAGAGNTLTTQLTGLTNHAVLVGAGTATITNVGPSSSTGQVLQSKGLSTDPAYSTATYPSTIAVSQLLYASSNNAISGLTTANQGVLTTGTTGIPVITSIATNGQLIIGSTAGAPAAATLTAGTGVTITNGAGSITINASGGAMTWSDQSGAFNALVNNGYFITNTSTATLPAAPSEGDTIAFVVDTTNILTITANAGQLIRIGTTISAAAGTTSSNARGDSIKLTYRATGTTWFSVSAPEGTWTVT